jgi:hypothetical protein
VIRRCSAVALAAVLLGAAGAPAGAADRVVRLVLDGRPVDRAGGIAVLHGGVVYADVVDLVKAFSGLLTLHGPAVWVTIGDTYAVFTNGSRTAKIDRGSIQLPGPCFMRNGDVYVPLGAFARVAKAQVRLNPARTEADVSVNANPIE